MYKEIEKFLYHIQYEKRFSRHTIVHYKMDLVDAMNFFVTHNISTWQNVQENNIHALLAFKSSQSLSEKTINRQLTALRTFYRFLIRIGSVTDNKASKILSLKTHHSLPKALDVDQMAKLLEYSPKNTLAIRDIALMELLYSTGLRVSEVVALDIADIDFKQQQLSVIGKGQKTRLALIGQFAIKALQQWLPVRNRMVQPQEKALFINKYGKRLSARAVQYRLYYIGLQQGIETRVSPHRLRHSFASHLLESSHDLRCVQELLGHTDLSTTQIYTKINFQHLANVYDQCHPRAKKSSRETEK